MTRRHRFIEPCHPERLEGSSAARNKILRCAQKDNRAGFTLFEVILAIALSAALLSVIGAAINMYLVRVDASRTRVEEAQLARSVLAMIADDIRATSIYQPQDTSTIAELMAKMTFDVDDIDASTLSTGSSGTSSASGSSAAKKVASAISSGQSGQSSSSGSSNDQAETDNTLPLGISGSAQELYIDVTRLPNQDELFRSVTGYTNAQSAAAMTGRPPGGSGAPAATAPTTDLKTVHYYVRPGDTLAPGAAAATSLDPAAQQSVGGLVRQEVPRAHRHFAEQNGNSDLLNSGEVLIAPEVVQIDLQFFNSGEVFQEWDMKEQQSLPAAVEVCIWLRSTNAASQAATSNGYNSLANAHAYRQVVFLPMAAVVSSAKTTSSSDTSTTDSSGNSSTDSSGDSSSGSGSSFDQLQR